MSRKCNVCCAEEYLLAIDARLRAGESCSSIAKEFGLSEDSVRRHAKTHLRSEKPSTVADPLNMIERLEMLWARADDTYTSAAKTGSYKAMLDALARLANIADTLSRLNAGKSGFEAMSVAEKVAYIRSDSELFCAVLDDIVKFLQLGNPTNTSTGDGQLPLTN